MNEEKNDIASVKKLYNIAEETLSLLEEKRELLSDEEMDSQKMSQIERQAVQNLILELDKKIQHLDKEFVKAYEEFLKQTDGREPTIRQKNILKKLQSKVESICVLRQMKTTIPVYKRKRKGMKEL